MFSHHALRRALTQRIRDETAHTPLTPREREIMQWVAPGKSDDEISDILSIGRTTVTAHVKNAKRKLINALAEDTRVIKIEQPAADVRRS